MKALISASFVAEFDTIDEVAEIVRAIEESTAVSMSAALERNDAAPDDLDGKLSWFGISATVERDLGSLVS